MFPLENGSAGEPNWGFIHGADTPVVEMRHWIHSGRQNVLVRCLVVPFRPGDVGDNPGQKIRPTRILL